MISFNELFYLDNLSCVMISLVGFVATTIACFAHRYLKGDRRRSIFFIDLLAMAVSVFILVVADHLAIFVGAWASSNLFLTKMMRYKSEWKAAHESAKLAFKSFFLAVLVLSFAFILVYTTTKETSIQSILLQVDSLPYKGYIGLCILLAAMVQSALWPFHRWLVSSLNSPTPVSAMMHAGLVNGGGFLLARFSPLFLSEPALLDMMFMLGVITALLGTLWKLMQSDIKRMLACSTMGQMGFMIVQCGLGLFPAAVAHLCWHGLFKAYLFLSSGNVAKEKRLDLDYPPKVPHFLLALLIGLLGAYCYAVVGQKDLLTLDTNYVLLVLAWMAGTQVALPLVRRSSSINYVLALLANIIIGTLYGYCSLLVEQILEPLDMLSAQPINLWHAIATLGLVLSWFMMLYAKYNRQRQYPSWVLKGYVSMLNASQPSEQTITAHRNQYEC